MAETTIEWTRGPNGEQGYTFNPWEGCQKVSPGCDNCYAETRNARFAGGTSINWGPGAPRRRTSASNWRLPIRWNKEAAAAGERRRVFCASLADVFDSEVDPKWRADLFSLIELTPNLDWLLLTKRIGNAPDMLTAWQWRRKAVNPKSVWPLPNVWIGATIVDQTEATRDIPKLIHAPAAKRFLSMEPLLGPVDLSSVWVPNGILRNMVPAIKKIDWVIVGGESGLNARSMHPQWVIDLRDQCLAVGTPFFFKQWGEWVPRSSCYHTFEDGRSCSDMDPVSVMWPCIRLTETGHNGRDLAHASQGDDAYMQRLGKKAAGRLLNGREWNGSPA